MIWLLTLGAAVVGLLRARRDHDAGRLALASGALFVDLAFCAVLGDGELASAGALARVAGPPLGLVAWFLPNAHLAYPVLVTYALAPLGRAAVWLGISLTLAAVVTSVCLGATWIDVGGGLALGKLIGWAMFDVTPGAQRLTYAPARS